MDRRKEILDIYNNSKNTRSAAASLAAPVGRLESIATTPTFIMGRINQTSRKPEGGALIKRARERKGKTADTAGPATPMEAVHTVRLRYARLKYNGGSKHVLLLKRSTPYRFPVFLFFPHFQVWFAATVDGAVKDHWTEAFPGTVVVDDAYVQSSFSFSFCCSLWLELRFFLARQSVGKPASLQQRSYFNVQTMLIVKVDTVCNSSSRFIELMSPFILSILFPFIAGKQSTHFRVTFTMKRHKCTCNLLAARLPRFTSHTRALFATASRIL